jgi:N-acetylneuraminic acid mutarotase
LLELINSLDSGPADLDHALLVDSILPMNSNEHFTFRIAWFAAICLAIFTSVAAHAQVPAMVRYQSTLVWGGTNYDGLGQFKFALVDAGGAQTSWSNDGTSLAGSEPQQGTELEVNQGSYEVLLGDTSLTNMIPLPSTVFTNANLNVRVWFRPGGGDYRRVEPDQALASAGYAMMAAQVADGAITSIKLADGAVTASKLAPEAVTQESIGIGAIGPQQLASGAAAANLRASGGLVLSDQPIASDLIAAGFKKIGTVSAETESWSTNLAFSPSPRGNHVAAWAEQELFIWGGSGIIETRAMDSRSGGIYNPKTDTWRVPNTTGAPSIEGVTSRGGVAVGVSGGVLVFPSFGNSFWLYTFATDKWRQLSSSNAPAGQKNATYVYTGTEVLVFGAGARHRYNLASDTWSLMTKSNAPSARQYHTAVWTGTEMIVWGGESESTQLRNGARYYPAADNWQPVALDGAPQIRAGHSAVWTGSSMIVWGGRSATLGHEMFTGGIYSPVSNTWQPINTNGVPSARQGHFAAWSGTQMIVYGGTHTTEKGQSYVLTDGARYNPDTRTWTRTATPPLGPMIGASMTWSGTELILWGGASYEQGTQFEISLSTYYGPFHNSGLRYNPATDQWRSLAYTPCGRLGHSTIWTGKEMIVWGGSPSRNASPQYGILNSGGKFNPNTGKWQPISTLNAPTARQGHKAVWTGKEMIVWGGLGNTNYSRPGSGTPLNTGARYNPSTDTWTAIETDGAPSPREGFSLVWTGREAIVFGGLGVSPQSIGVRFTTNNGALYRPDTDQWTSLSLVNAPSPRYNHIALWTGNEMIVWGGTSNRQVLAAAAPNRQGARYRPDSNTWIPMATNRVPLATTNQVAVWTGESMLVFGVPSNSSSGRYSPEKDSWEPLATYIGTLQNPDVPTAVWTGSEMIVCTIDNEAASRVGRYDPELNAWTTVTRTRIPPGRLMAQGVWTGTELLSFGGYRFSDVRILPNEVVELSLTSKLFLYSHP